MFSLLILDRSGTVQEKKTKGIERLYSLCNYRSQDGFEELYTWKHPTMSYVLYGKRKGKNHFENNCKLPPPLQIGSYYGHLCVIKFVDKEPQSLTIEEWTRFIDQDQNSTQEKQEEIVESKELKKEDYEPEP